LARRASTSPGFTLGSQPTRFTWIVVHRISNNLSALVWYLQWFRSSFSRWWRSRGYLIGLCSEPIVKYRTRT
jgi:hypothetical protein